MANHRISPGSWGGMSEPVKLAKSLYRTSGRYRTLDGLRRPQRFATGSTPRKAKIALQAVFERMAADDRAKRKADDENAKTIRHQGDETQFAVVVEEWILYIEAGGKGIRASTAYEYTRMARNDIIPALGALKLADVDIKACADFLHGLVEGNRNHAKAQHNRAVLSNILTWCAGRGLVPGNPVKQVATLPQPPRGPVKIIEKEDMATVLAAVRQHGEQQMMVRRPGPPQNLDVPDGVELLMATGVRISELLGLRWEDVWIDDLDDGSFWVQINGMVGWIKGSPMIRYEYTKTGDKILDLRISPEVAAMLRTRRSKAKRAHAKGPIFPGRGEVWMQHNNFRNRWRKVRVALNIEFDLPEDTANRKQERRESCDIAIVTPHTFRRSVATFIAEEVSIEQAARQLGHKQTAVTIRSYVKERQEAPDSSQHLARIMYKRDQPAD